jgi:hypothetical protein
MKIEERVRPLIFYTSAVGLILSIILLTGYIAGIGTSDAALASMGLMLGVACMFGCFYKRTVFVDSNTKQIITKQSLLVSFATHSYSFNDISTIHVRKELASTQGADIERQANTSHKTPLFIVYADLKGFKKGKKRRIHIKKFFKQAPADALAIQLAAIVAV